MIPGLLSMSVFLLFTRSQAFCQFTRRVKHTFHRLPTSSLSTIPTSNVTFAAPIKAMVFIDGTWLYYTMIEGRENCPIQRKYGIHWKRTHTIDYLKLTQLIATNLQEQIYAQSRAFRAVDIVRTYVFTSLRQDTEGDSYRQRMVIDMLSSNFEVHRFLTDGRARMSCTQIFHM